MENVKACYPVRVKTIEDVLRMIFSSGGRGGANLIHIEHNGKHVYGILNNLPAYYDLKGLPMFVHVVTEQKPETDFVGYQGVRKEEWKFVAGVLDDPKWISIPIVHLSDPAFLLDLGKI